MYDKKKTFFKVVFVGIISAIMGVMLHAYNVHAEPINAALGRVTYALSPSRELAYWKVKAEFRKAHSNYIEVTTPDTWHGVPAFVYHGIVKEADRFNMTEETFKDQMFALKLNGYETVTLEEFNAYIKDGIALPPKSFLLTFDDGRRDSYEGADAVLRALDYTAVMFVAVESSMPSSGENSTYYLSAAELSRMANSGRWQIGSHAIQQTGGYVPVSETGAQGNFLSNVAWIPSENRLETEDEYMARITEELVGSKRMLEEEFETTITAFSYPFGDYGQQSLDNVNAVASIESIVGKNYPMAFRQVWQPDGEFAFNYEDTPAEYLKRIESPTDWTGDQLVDFLELSHDKALPFTDYLTEDLGWHNYWGEKHLTENNILTIEATPETTGATVFLDGSKMWSDYSLNVTLASAVGSHFSLLAQYQDADNYLICTFGEGRAKIERMANGKLTKLTDVQSTRSFARGGNYSFSVVGETVTCSIDNVAVAWTRSPGAAGGVGMKIWDSEMDIAQANFAKIEVIPQVARQ